MYRKSVFLTLFLFTALLLRGQQPVEGTGVMKTDLFPFEAEALDMWVVMDISREDAQSHNFLWDDRLQKMYSILFLKEDMSSQFRMFVWRYDHVLEDSETTKRLNRHVSHFEIGQCQDRVVWQSGKMKGFKGGCANDEGTVKTQFLAFVVDKYVVSLSHINNAKNAPVTDDLLKAFYSSVKYMGK